MPVSLKTDTDLWHTAGEPLKATLNLRPMNFHQHTKPGDALDNERTGHFDKVMFAPVCKNSLMVHHSWFMLKPWRSWWKGDLTQCSLQLERPPLTCGSSLHGEPEDVEIILYLTSALCYKGPRVLYTCPIHIISIDTTGHEQLQFLLMYVRRKKVSGV